MHILGSAQLAVMPLNGLQAPVRFHTDRLYGDKSGFLHVGYNQNFSIAVTDPDIPFGLRVYENGSMMLPRRAFLQTVSFKSSGKVSLRFTFLCSVLFDTFRQLFTAMITFCEYFNVGKKIEQEIMNGRRRDVIEITFMVLRRWRKRKKSAQSHWRDHFFKIC